MKKFKLIRNSLVVGAVLSISAISLINVNAWSPNTHKTYTYNAVSNNSNFVELCGSQTKANKYAKILSTSDIGTDWYRKYLGYAKGAPSLGVVLRSMHFNEKNDLGPDKAANCLCKQKGIYTYSKSFDGTTPINDYFNVNATDTSTTFAPFSSSFQLKYYTGKKDKYGKKIYAYKTKYFYTKSLTISSEEKQIAKDHGAYICPYTTGGNVEKFVWFDVDFYRGLNPSINKTDARLDYCNSATNLAIKLWNSGHRVTSMRVLGQGLHAAQDVFAHEDVHHVGDMDDITSTIIKNGNITICDSHTACYSSMKADLKKRINSFCNTISSAKLVSAAADFDDDVLESNEILKLAVSSDFEDTLNISDDENEVLDEE